jgi:predicted TIM-barrel fold metal-dependent hydrolase
MIPFEQHPPAHEYVRVDADVPRITDLDGAGNAAQWRTIVERIGPDHLAFGPQLPFAYVDSYHNYLDNLPVDETDRERVGATNVLDLVEEP